MSAGRFLAVAVAGICGVLLSTGCGPTAAEMQITKLQEDNDRLARENGDLQMRLAQEIAAKDAAARRALELQRLLDEAQRGPMSSDMPEGFVGTKDVAWTEVEESILFDSGKAVIKPEGKRKLRDVMQQIDTKLDWADRDIYVVGHTDSDPIDKSKNLWKDNWDLSAGRSLAVVREFTTLGVSPKRLIVAGRGEYAPKVPNRSKSDKAQNRRVQIIVARIPGFTAPSMADGGTTGG